MEDEARVDEGKEFHILGADELKAREPMIVRTPVDEPGFGRRSAMIDYSEVRIQKTRQIVRLAKSNNFVS